MFTLPPDVFTLLMQFVPLFSPRVWRPMAMLFTGALLTPGRRIVTNALRILGDQDEPHFQNFHRVLNRASWSSRQAAEVLLRQLIRVFAPRGVVLLGIDEHLERRAGEQIAARGIYRDAARSSKAYLTKASGLRGVSPMLLTPLGWAGRVWALPFLTVLAPSERYHQPRQQRQKALADHARQMLRQVRRWLPNRELVVVADSSYAVLALLAACQRLRHAVICVTRLRLDAALYAPAAPREPGQRGRPRCKGARLPALASVLTAPETVWTRLSVARWYSEGPREVEYVTGSAVWYRSGEAVVPLRWVLVRDPARRFAPQALLCTDLNRQPAEILAWFVQRWQLEVTFEEARAHLGIETQRQWNALAIQRTTPVLLGLFSVVTLLADRQAQRGPLAVRQAAWYRKRTPTFADALVVCHR